VVQIVDARKLLIVKSFELLSIRTWTLKLSRRGLWRTQPPNNDSLRVRNSALLKDVLSSYLADSLTVVGWKVGKSRFLAART
jgi:hypothetical protein